MNTVDFVHTTYAGNLLRKRRRRAYGLAAVVCLAAGAAALSYALGWLL